jgi:hypothetical protein
MNQHILERLATISPEKRKLLELLLKEEGVKLGQIGDCAPAQGREPECVSRSPLPRSGSGF